MTDGLRGGTAFIGSGLAGMMEDTSYTCVGWHDGASWAFATRVFLVFRVSKMGA